MKFFNSVTGQIEDDGQPTPELAPDITIPAGRIAYPKGQGDIKIPMTNIPQQRAFERAAGKDVGLDIQQNPQNYPFANLGDLGMLTQAQAPQNVPTQPIVPETPEKPTEKKADTSDVDKLVKAGDTAEEQAYKETRAVAGVQKGYEEEVDSRLAGIKKISDNIAAAQAKAYADAATADENAQKLEPKDFWADKSTGARIAAAIAVGIGGYAGALTGQGNQAMIILDNAIKNDLMLQKEKYQRAKDRGASIRSAFADQMTILKDTQAAELTLYNAGLKNAELKLKQIEANSQNEVQKLNAQKLLQEIGLKAQEAQDARLQRLATQKALGAPTGDQVDINMLPKDIRERYVQDPEFGGAARSEQAANKVSESLIEYRTAKDLLKTLREISTTPAKSLRPGIKAEAATAAAALKGKLRGPIVGQGAVSESEWKILNSIVANPTDFFTLDAKTKARLDSLDNLLDSNMYNTSKAYGINPKMKASATNAVVVRTSDGQNVRIPRQNLPEAQRRAKEKGISLEVIDAGS